MTKSNEVIVVIEQGKTIELLSVEELEYRSIDKVLNDHFPHLVVRNGTFPVVVNVNVVNENSKSPTLVLLYLIYIEDFNFKDCFDAHINTRHYGYLDLIEEGFWHPDLNMETNEFLTTFVWPFVNNVTIKK
jgi:hypothetical protein